MNEIDYKDLWARCLSFIKDNISEQQYKTWFKPIVPLKYENGTLTIKIPSNFFYEFLEERYSDLIKTALYKYFGKGTMLRYKIVIDSTRPGNGGTTEVPSTSHAHAEHSSRTDVQTAELPQPVVRDIDPHLNPNCGFDTFVEGMSNKLARSVGEAVAEKPGKTAFNPLFIYGASGVGKTHLVNAIGLKVKELYPQLRVLYVSANLFKVQYTESVCRNKTNDFINFYQTVDVLIIDDVQEFTAQKSTQNTFFHIFNQLHQNGRQLIMTSDRPPKELQGIEDRLITRFKWGMVAELEKPTLELRKDILRSKISRDGLKFPEEVIDYIAENVTDNVRDLEGVVVAIMANATIYNKKIGIRLAEQVVKKSISMAPKTFSVDHIIETVCKHYGIKSADMAAKSRKRDIVQARQVAMYLTKNYTDYSAAKIGALIGNRDHATVLHALKAVNQMKEVDKQFSANLEAIQTELKA